VPPRRPLRKIRRDRTARGWQVGIALAALWGGAGAQTNRIADARRSLAELNGKQGRVAAQVGANRSELSRLLGALELFARDPPPALLVSPADTMDAVRGVILIRAIAPELEARALRLSSQAREMANLRRQVAAAEGELFEAESALEDRSSRLEGVASEADLLVPPGARNAIATADQTPRPRSLLLPAKGAVVSSFGAPLHAGGRSRGLVISTVAGSPVTSPAAGVVDYAGPLEGWGQIVILGAGGGYHVVLSGIGKTLAVPGQKVVAGAPLGLMPATGAPRPELYLEVRLGRAPIDPAPLMKEALAKRPLLRRKLL
jgi:septal ring factor EnvC (AmiA/AmiB activator)